MKKNSCAFTIVAKNYIGLAIILGRSIQKHTPNVDFWIVVADEFATIPDNLPSNILFAKKIIIKTDEVWNNMTFQYDLTEFCTAIKPGCISYFMDMGYEKVLYFDPDIFVYSSLQPIVTSLDEYQVVLTPQIVGIHINYKGEHPEWAMNCNGIFNLGFGGYRKTDKVIRLLKWWDKRLETECFSDRTIGNFTDQKWMDWVPGFFNGKEFSSLDSLGMNLAPWNYFERRVEEKDGVFYVTFRTDDNPKRKDPLVFIHFAGYDYQAFKNGEIKRKRIENLNQYDDLFEVSKIYAQEISNNTDIFDMYINQPYTYGVYENGVRIEPFHRRLFHGILISKNSSFNNPFSVTKDSFFETLRSKRMIDHSGKSQASRASMGDVRKKRKIIEKLFGVIFKLGGYKRYVLFTRALIDYCRPEFHTYLVKKKL